jgi:Ala-tRNA(Pro) deacylase
MAYQAVPSFLSSFAIIVSSNGCACVVEETREQRVAKGSVAMECRDRLEDYLRENGVPFEVQHHPRTITAQEVAATEHVPGKMLAKVVMVLVDGEMVMLTLAAPYQVNLEKVGKVLGADKARLAEEEEFEGAFPDCEVGAMPPFGNLYDLPVYVEEDLTEDETIYFRAGTHTDTMSVRYADFERLVEPTVAEFADRD